MNTPWGAQQAKQNQTENPFNWNHGNTIEVKQDTLPAATVIPETAMERFDIQAAALAEINKYLALKIDIYTPATVQAVKDAKSKVRELRLKVQRREKKINSDLNDQKKRLKKDVSDVTGPIKAVETYLAGEIKKYDDHKAKLKAEEEEKERQRLIVLQNEIDTLSKHCEKALIHGLDASQIRGQISCLEAIIIAPEIFQERFQEACNLLNHAIEQANIRLTEREAFESAEAERKAMEARLKAQAEINEQTAWFNDNFGFAATYESIDSGLKTLLSMHPSQNIAALVDQQKRKAVEIVDRGRMCFEAAYDDAHASIGAFRLGFEDAWKEAHMTPTHIGFDEAWDEAHPKQPEIKQEPKKKGRAMQTTGQIHAGICKAIESKDPNMLLTISGTDGKVYVEIHEIDGLLNTLRVLRENYKDIYDPKKVYGKWRP